MLKQLTPSAPNQQPHYSFMRPGDFIWFVFLLIFTAWKFWSAYGLADRFFIEWISYATISLLLVIWYAWMRIKRRQCCEDAGELMIALMLPQAYQMFWKHYTKGDDELNWSLFWVFAILLIVMAFRVWRAPKIAKDLEELRAAAEEAARHAPADPRFTHVENP
jgi:hypothetical protein